MKLNNKISKTELCSSPTVIYRNIWIMKKKKCLLFVRASTNHQETQSQLNETRKYAESLGYNEFVILGGSGFSAYKVSKKYVELLDEFKNILLTDKSIDGVVVWAINRLSRNPSKSLEIEEFLVQNKIQLHCKIPQLTLLNDDGTENDAASMIFTIYSKISQHEIKELQAKARRGKAEKRALHKFQGGARPPFGYTMDENNNVLPHPTEAPILAEIFDLYATGQYSFPKLIEEINARHGLDLHTHSAYNFLHRKLYYDGSMYPPIITQTQFNAAAQVRDNSRARPSVYKHFTFANRLIKCPRCGKGYTSTERKYICHKFNKCHTPTIATAHLDGLLWLICSHLESERLLNTSAKDEYLEKKAVLEAKIDGVAQTLTKGEKRAERAKKMCLSDLLTIEEYKAILAEVEAEQKETKRKVGEWKAQITELDRLIAEDGKSVQRILQISNNITSADEQEMRTIVRRWIKQITFEGDIWTVETITRTYKAVYNCYGFPSRWKTINGNFLAVRPLKREKDVCEFQDIKLKPTELPYTLGWLSGSEIV